MWPGFVDALATLVIAVVFVMMVFAVFQFYLKDVIAGRDDQLARAATQRAGHVLRRKGVGQLGFGVVHVSLR